MIHIKYNTRIIRGVLWPDEKILGPSQSHLIMGKLRLIVGGSDGARQDAPMLTPFPDSPAVTTPGLVQAQAARRRL